MATRHQHFATDEPEGRPLLRRRNGGGADTFVSRQFDESLGSRRRLLAELFPVLDFCGVRPKRDWTRILLGMSLLGLMLWIGNLPQSQGPAFAADWPRWLRVGVPSVIWLWLIAKGLRKAKRDYFGWHDYDYENFVLHKKYRFRNWSP